MCLYPKLIENRRYIPNKKNGGIVPSVSDERVLRVAAGCGKCIECYKKKGRDWSIRLREEIKEHKNGKMITLTFSNYHYTNLAREINNKKGYALDNAIATLAVRRFLERWRKKYKKSIRHWLVTEIGGGKYEHLHLHGILWTNEDIKEIDKYWKYGFVWKGYEGKKTYVNQSTISYISKYFTKIDPKHKYYRPIILCSQGIGKGYIKSTTFKKHSYIENNTREHYRTESGHRLALPMYYRNKAFSEEEKEKLWIEKLNKQERYVLGCKIDISKSEDEYWKAVLEAREYNKEMLYGGGNSKDDEIYENERRILKQLMRDKNNNNKNIRKMAKALSMIMNIEKKIIRALPTRGRAFRSMPS